MKTSLGELNHLNKITVLPLLQFVLTSGLTPSELTHATKSYY